MMRSACRWHRIATLPLLVGLMQCSRVATEDLVIREGRVPRGASTYIMMKTPSGDIIGALKMERGSGDGVRVSGTLLYLPEGPHGIHLHAIGRCDLPGYESAGPHFNPRRRKHGLENPAGPHAGDAPSVASTSVGRTRVDVEFPAGALTARADSGLWDADGSALVIHASADDQKTDPDGNSGVRIACGVIPPLH
jgi:Cu-Zn family superoxide dismutase